MAGPTQLRQASGFTLVELLVSMTIAAVVASILGMSLMGLNRGWEQQSQAISQQDSLRRGLRVLRRDVRSLIRSQDAGLRGEPSLLGNADHVEFLVRSRTLRGDARPSRITYAIKRDGASARLVRSTQPLRQGAGVNSLHHDPSPVVVLDGVVNLRLSYGMLTRQGLQWRNRWSEIRQPPSLIAIEISTEQNKPVPLVIIDLPTDSLADCVSPLSRTCIR